MSEPMVFDARSPAERDAAAKRLREVEDALNRPRLVTVSARDLIANPPPKPVEVIPGLVPAGLSLLASAPKVGKSWLAYQAAVAVATGGDVLGRRAAQGDALYLALEDGEYRAWSRITSILRRTTGRETMPRGAAALDVAFLAGRGDELVEQVEEWLARHAGAAFVLIDTLQKVRPRTASRQPQYAIDVDDVGRILGVTQRHPGIALQVVHHDTKASRAPGSDFVDAVSGTSGIAGSVDALLVLRRRRHETAGTLEVTGKDVRESLMHLAYDDDEPFWTVDPLGGLSEGQARAFGHISAHGPIGATALGAALGMSKQSAAEVADRLVDLGAVEKEGRGQYRAAVSVNVVNE